MSNLDKRTNREKGKNLCDRENRVSQSEAPSPFRLGWVRRQVRTNRSVFSRGEPFARTTGTVKQSRCEMARSALGKLWGSSPAASLLNDPRPGNGIAAKPCPKRRVRPPSRNPPPIPDPFRFLPFSILFSGRGPAQTGAKRHGPCATAAGRRPGLPRWWSNSTLTARRRGWVRSAQSRDGRPVSVSLPCLGDGLVARGVGVLLEAGKSDTSPERQDGPGAPGLCPSGPRRVDR
jgi:hypothetical protein